MSPKRPPSIMGDEERAAIGAEHRKTPPAGVPVEVDHETTPPPASPGLVGDAGPCGLVAVDTASGAVSVTPCTAATHYIDAALTQKATCENAGDVFEECQ